MSALTLEEIFRLSDGDYIWLLRLLGPEKYGYGYYYQIHSPFSDVFYELMSKYGKDYIAYKNKELAEEDGVYAKYL